MKFEFLSKQFFAKGSSIYPKIRFSAPLKILKRLGRDNEIGSNIKQYEFF